MAPTAAYPMLQSGKIVLGYNAIQVSNNDVVAFTKKLVRGLHFAHYGKPVAGDHELITAVLAEESWPMIFETMDHLGAQRRGVPPDSTTGTRFQADGCGVWCFLIWEQILLQGPTIPPEAQSQPTG